MRLLGISLVLLLLLGSAEASENNAAFVRDEAPVLREIRDLTRDARKRGDWNTWVRAWQTLVDLKEDVDEKGAAAPYVFAVRDTTVFEGAARVAHQSIIRAGEKALTAYARIYGEEADAHLAEAIRTGRRPLLEEVATRFLPLPSGRRAALLLADLAQEAGDGDQALEWLERLEDLEEVEGGTEPPWREARIRRLAAVPPEPTPAASVGRRLAPAWFASLGDGTRDEDDGSGQRPSPARPSPWVPPRAVTDGRWVFLSTGGQLHAVDARTGKRVAEPFDLADDEGYSLFPSGEDLRVERGLLEGHTLALGPGTPRGQIVYVAVPNANDWGDPWRYGQMRNDRLEAFHWTGRRFRRLWRIGGTYARDGMPAGTRLYGTPLLYRDRLWIAGIRPTRGSEDQAEAWLFGLDPRSGEVQVRTWLGGGPPVRVGRADEAIPSSPAGRAGRVVVGTSLGVLVAVDARDGRVAWALRYERGAVARGRVRRLGEKRDGTPRQSGFKNLPPLLAYESVYFGPTDAPHVLILFDRPRGQDRALVKWRLHRRFDFQHFAVEQLVGLHPGSKDHPPRLLLAGKGVAPEGDPPAPMVLALNAHDGTVLWRGISTTGHGAEPFGRALVTAGEIIVPTAHGLVVYDVLSGKDLHTADVTMIPDGWREALPEGASLFGNLTPAPGGGLFATNGRVLTLWRGP